MPIDDQINSLTKNEMTVLYYKCKGLNHEQIRIRLGYSKDWVQLQMSTVYSKLGFEKSMHWTKRRDILKNEICPRLPKSIDDWQPLKEITEEIREEPMPDPEMMALVVYDEMEIEKEENKALIPPKPIKPIVIIDEEKKDKWKNFRRIFFAVVSLIVLLGVAYFTYGLNRGATPAPQIVVITATFPPITDTPLPTATSVIPTDTLVPTDIPTPVPTNTLIPTVFAPPADGILFQDDFKSGDLSAWTQYGSQWIVSNGKLTMLANDVNSYSWIGLERPEWKNYILSVDITIPYQGSAAQTRVVVAISKLKAKEMM